MATTKPDEAVLTALPVLDGEDPWTAEEVAAVRAELIEERDRLRAAVAHAQAELAALMTEGSDGAGRDPADVGSSNFERDQELSLHNNQRNMLDQTEQAAVEGQRGVPVLGEDGEVVHALDHGEAPVCRADCAAAVSGR